VNALSIEVDVADHNLLDAAAERVENELGPIDVWVNNAMVTIFAPVHKIEPEEFHRVTAVTYLGQVHGTMAALKRMRRRNRGTIVQVGSALSYRAVPLQIGLLRRKIRGARLHGFAANGACARGKPDQAHDGAVAGGQHASVRLGAQPNAEETEAIASDLPARSDHA
jgi:NAD(P)-dependent dehydrogenase (short-subunit alcohol dehydrogenase family)